MLNSKKRDAEERQARIDKIQSKCRREVDRVEALRGVSEGKVRIFRSQFRSIMLSRPKFVTFFSTFT